MGRFGGPLLVGVVTGLVISAARAEDPPVTLPAEAHLARAEPFKDAAAQPNVPSRAAAGSLSARNESVAAQEYLARRAARMPGVSCDPDGPVYQVLGDTEPGLEPPSGRTDLLVHFAAGGEPDQVRIERSAGDPDLDALVALTVCEAPAVRDAVPKKAVSAGWARLSIRLAASD